MVAKLALALAALFAVLALLSWFLRAPPQNVARMLRRVAVVAGIGLLVYLAATGRLHWLFALLGSLLAFLPRLLPLLPVVGGLYKRYRAAKAAQAASGGAATGRVSQVETRYVRMSLNHDTGEIDGVVIDGRFKGARLTELSVEQLIDLLRECRIEDPEAAQLVQAFLDGVHGATWRAQDSDGAPPGGDHRPPPAAGAMSREEAWEILGLSPGAGEDEIVAAHRRLMQKLHPDRGGSGWLAVKINQAKDLLLGK